MTIVAFPERSLRSSSTACALFTGACLSGWDALTGGHWAHGELDYVSSLALPVILLALQPLCTVRTGCRIRLRSDNATAIDFIGHCGCTRPTLQALTQQFFEWAGF